MPTRAIATDDLRSLTAEAKGLLAELERMGAELEQRLTAALERSWQLGGVLLRIKGIVGHGNWLVWIEANLPMSSRHAQRHIELAMWNPDAQSVEQLSAESVRKFRLGLVPEKERPQLDGDAALPRVCHHLTLLNDWRRLTRRVETGHAQFDAGEAKRDLAPLFAWLCGLYGVEPPSQK